MRILIDLQACQNENRFRGIGRYSIALAKALCGRNDGNEYWIALNASMPETGDALRGEFSSLVPAHRIVSWDMPTPTRASNPANRWREQTGEWLRESVLAYVNADILVLSSVFDGLHDDSVTSVKLVDNGVTQTIAIVYDLIPLIYSTKYLSDPLAKAWYYRKLAVLNAADGWLCISEHARQEAVDVAGIDSSRAFNIVAASDSIFGPRNFSNEERAQRLLPLGITRPYVMYTGGLDERKNIRSLLVAYAQLPHDLRMSHQLVLVGKASPGELDTLAGIARRSGLQDDELIMTGYVDDESLAALYNLCKVFAFPSLHEGFGLPALEAMACGRAVIGSNASSIPEVIGRPDALFDPRSIEDCNLMLLRVLTDEVFRADLEAWGVDRAATFSWDACAARAVEAMEGIRSRQPSGALVKEQQRAGHVSPRPRMAMVTPLPPARSGIADYAEQLIPQLCRHYDIDVILEQDDVVSPWVQANCGVRNVSWFVKNVATYDRIVYQVGNSTFHTYMFDLIARYPGVVVLHDFFLSSIAAYLEISGERPGWWARWLYESHGYPGLVARREAADPQEAMDSFPCNLPVLQAAQGLIVHSRTAIELAAAWYGSDAPGFWHHIPLLRESPAPDARLRAREELGLLDDEFMVCSFGILAYTKLNEKLIEAWLTSRLAQDSRCRLVFVGESPNIAYTALLNRLIDRGAARIKITGHVSAAEYATYLAAADVGVQLRSHSRGETSAAVLDCMVNGIATIVNAHGSMAEFSNEEVFVLDDKFSTEALSNALELLFESPDLRARLGRQARENLLNGHAPDVVASRYADAIEDFYGPTTAAGRSHALIDTLVGLDHIGGNREADLDAVARALARNQPPAVRQRVLLVDVSVTANEDLRTGIERVVRSVTLELLRGAAGSWRVEPVRATEHGYVYAHRYTCELLGLASSGLSDMPIDVAAGDLFLGLDLAQMDLPKRLSDVKRLRLAGVACHFVVYDMLPIQFPQFFPEWLAPVFRQWFLSACAVADGLWCISESVADDVMDTLAELRPSRVQPLAVGSFPLGSDLASGAPSTGISDADTERLNSLDAAPVFLMVGTVEPRKGHSQVVDAFELLHERGGNAQLVIVGKHGWMVEALAERVETLCRRGKARIHWFSAASDELLAALYERADALIAASYGEGYGLPLIEAAGHGIPIIARDIPVFREVGGEHATYFASKDGRGLARDIEDWLRLNAAGQVPESRGIAGRTWANSALQLIKNVTGGQSTRVWSDRGVRQP
ncbi:glycosyltransferase involved in cell wall biosynthesis [Luteibacter sp. 1214]|uniref:glycosyltransferase n=1 Tax=Luteibacter sp. 1214 TaxID=2817735 RepID=UPI00285BB04D|nr:glycosyltransferase [Luteibacter sp. 1214]MDR6642683.1 glycosyltransferase involved in cell wall biosynthesis [Luteibacter sp. 1214]